MAVHAEVIALHQHSLSGRELGARALLHAAGQLDAGDEREDPRHAVPGTGDHGVLEIDGGPFDPHEHLALGKVGVREFDHRGPNNRSRLGEQVGREAHGLTVEGGAAVFRRVRLHRVRSAGDYDRRVWAMGLSASAAGVAQAKVSLSDLCSDGAALFWLESRPSEGGRTVVVRADAHGLADHSPDGVSIRSRVNEYGGGALCLGARPVRRCVRLRRPVGPEGVAL